MMLLRGAGVLAALSLCGCMGGSDANIYHSLQGQQVVGNENSVIISNVWNEMDALPLADQHCKKYSKSARFKSFGCARAAFDCI